MYNVELADKIDDLLGEFCSAGYALGLIGEANIKYVVENYPELVMVQRVYRLGDQACLKHGVTEDETLAEKLAELLEFLEQGWANYPVFDEQYLGDVVAEAEHVCVDYYATDWDIPAEFIWNAVYELQTYFEWEQDYAYYVGELDELKAKAQELGQTWSAHYNSEMSHTPEVCGYCAEAKEVA